MSEIKWKDAMKVIRAAKKLGVTSMKLGTLEFVIDGDSRASRTASKVSAKKIAEQNEKNQLQEKFDSAKEDLSVMHVEDPVGFEQALVDKELVEEAGGGESLGEETFGQ